MAEQYAVVDGRDLDIPEGRAVVSPRLDPHEQLERVKALTRRATDDTKLWQEIVFAAIDYGYARATAAIDRIGRKA